MQLLMVQNIKIENVYSMIGLFMSGRLASVDSLGRLKQRKYFKKGQLLISFHMNEPVETKYSRVGGVEIFNFSLY